MNENKNIEVSSILIDWYNKNKRDLPWRDTDDPYVIWLSEIILQQTRVDQGYDYFTRILDQYPNVKLLAAADENDILKLWQGLGYYSRARNLHAAAKTIVDVFDGRFPRIYKDVLSLKGVGDYTAAAIMSFAYDEPYAVVDGNVFRVLSRLFAIETPIDSTKGKKEFTQLAQALMSLRHPGLHNQAIMEFGALQCVPKSPDCMNCPAAAICISYAMNKVDEYPIKAGKQRVSNRYLNYFDIFDNGSRYIYKREEDDIWKNLYEFPLVETDQPLNLDDLDKVGFLSTVLGDSEFEIELKFKAKHVLSHRIINAVFFRVNVLGGKLKDEGYERISSESLVDYPMSRLMHRYLESLD